MTIWVPTFPLPVMADSRLQNQQHQKYRQHRSMLEAYTYSLRTHILTLVSGAHGVQRLLHQHAFLCALQVQDPPEHSVLHHRTDREHVVPVARCPVHHLPVDQLPSHPGVYAPTYAVALALSRGGAWVSRACTSPLPALPASH
jgi:hypothetical protein